MEDKNKTISKDTFYTLKEGDRLFPLVGLWSSNIYGKEDAEEKAKKVEMEVTLVQVKEIK